MTGETTFIREAFRHWRTVGAVSPSGKALAAALVGDVAYSTRTANILEVGAGTGAVTRSLLSVAPRDSRIDIVEANPRFVARLRRLAGPHAGVEVHSTYLETFETDRRYDAIVSGLPLANFDPAQVEKIMSRFMMLLRPGGVLTYFEYIGLRFLRRLYGSQTESKRQSVLSGFQDAFAVERRRVWPNLPPARVWHLRKPVSAQLALATVRQSMMRPAERIGGDVV